MKEHSSTTHCSTRHWPTTHWPTTHCSTTHSSRSNNVSFFQILFNSRHRNTRVIIGTIGSSRRAFVRGGGLVVLHASTTEEITINWWIGADDRWYQPENEITTRQHLVRNAPIVQTSVRIPSGDAVLTSFGAVQGQRELVVCDVENRSKVPFALSVVLQGPGVRNVSMEGSVVRVDGFPLITLARPPQRFAAVRSEEDLAAVVMSGDAQTHLPIVSGPSQVAVIVPVTHGTTFRFAALLGASSGIALTGTPVLASLPEVHRAAAGWGIHLSRLPQLALPDTEFNARHSSHGAALLLAAEPAIANGALPVHDRASLAEALAINGCFAESGALLERAADIQLSNGSFCVDDDVVSAHMIYALSLQAILSRDRLFAESLAPTVAGGLEFLMKRASRTGNSATLSVLASAQQFFVVAGDTRAADQCKKQWKKAKSPWPLPPLPVPPLPAISAGGSLVPDENRRLSRFVASAVEDVVAIAGDGHVELLGAFRPEWRGVKLDVRNVATIAGRLSFSLRWHGERPALLWDIEEPTGVPVSLRCESIDTLWAAGTLKGDALLNVTGPAMRPVVRRQNSDWVL
jgi:hypothetical protein